MHTSSCEAYRTKMKISRWAEVLDDRFVRVHRSYIVNRDLITDRSSQSVCVCGRQIEVSRSYRVVLTDLTERR